MIIRMKIGDDDVCINTDKIIRISGSRETNYLLDLDGYQSPYLEELTQKEYEVLLGLLKKSGKLMDNKSYGYDDQEREFNEEPF